MPTTSTSTDQLASNKAVFTRCQEALRTGDIELVAQAIDEVVAPDVLLGTPLPVQSTGAAALKEVFTKLLHAFPDLDITVEDAIAEGDKVVYRNTVTGTHRGEFMGAAPTGRTISYREIFVVRIADGRIAETWGIVDVLSLMRQLGVLPEAAA